ERLDDIVAIAPGVRPDFVGFESFALGVAGKVEPMARQAFAVTGGSEQAVHELVERFGGVVGEESVHFLKCRWQANEIEGRTPDQSDLVRGWCGLQPFGLQFGENERIDRISHPVGLLNLGRFWVRNFLKRPVSAFLRAKRHFTVVAWSGHSRCGGADQREGARREELRFLAPVHSSEVASAHWVFGAYLIHNIRSVKLNFGNWARGEFKNRRKRRSRRGNQ